MLHATLFMKIFIAHATDFPQKAEFYKAIRESKLNSKFEFVLPQENGEQVPAPRDVILSHDMLIAEISVPSHGVGIELGWAEAAGKPVICLYKEGAKFSGALKNVSNKFLMYTSFDNMIEDMEKALQQYE